MSAEIAANCPPPMAAVQSPAMPPPTHDPADEAMCMRARERFAADRKRGGRVPRRRRRHAALPNLIIIGGLKCGTTSIHHYLGLHPEIDMSKPKELNFFVDELNWDLGLDWYRGRFDEPLPGPRRVLPALHEPALLRGRPGADPRAHPRREADLHGPGPDLPDPLPLAPRCRRRLRDPADGGGAGPRRPDLRDPLALLDAAPALPRALRPLPDRGHHPGGAPERSRGDDAEGLRLRRRRRELLLRAVLSRMGELDRPRKPTATSSWRG